MFIDRYGPRVMVSVVAIDKRQEKASLRAPPCGGGGRRHVVLNQGADGTMLLAELFRLSQFPEKPVCLRCHTQGCRVMMLLLSLLSWTVATPEPTIIVV